MDQKRLIIVRHGQTDWNITGKFTSWSDVELNGKGCEQAELLAQRLNDYGIDRIVSSPRKRTVQTAQAVARLKKLQIQTDDRLREMDFGIFESKSPVELKSGDLASEFNDWRLEQNPRIPDGAESYDAAGERAISLYNSIASFDGTTLLVTHGVFGRIFLARCILNMPPSYYRRLRMDNGRLTIVEWEGDLPRLVGLNL